jgi:hypothetical protein
VLGYVRSGARTRVLVLANMGARPATIAALSGRGTVLAATGERLGTPEIGGFELAPLEGVVLDMRSPSIG